MNERVQAGPGAESAGCGALLPSTGRARRRTASVAGSVRSRAVGAGGDRMLLPDGRWRRVETIRVPRLFG
ncbi:hypothetical protein [Streptomyces sp. CoH27]|uniref:hypothetical protein n=1 Tax=Streptomyces sp. CoH27 TaxID=2875763 RepID=UPI001CD6969D|nr:hypothetical protein [Streptomyces sp. CoH27]